jgi:preprotein translocase subunit SecA
MLISEIHLVFVPLRDLRVEDIKNLRYSDMADKLKDLALKAYDTHEEEIVKSFNTVMDDYSPETPRQKAFSDDNILRTIEKDVLLQIIDSKWIDHLNNIDMLKDSIGLVAYGQKDPLIEYKKEAFDLFNSMMSQIQSETVRHIFRARFGVQVEENQIPHYPYEENQEVETELTKALKTSKSNAVEEFDDKPFVRNDAKVGRNDLCPCGSGKKYKQCCGKKG